LDKEAIHEMLNGTEYSCLLWSYAVWTDKWLRTFRRCFVHCFRNQAVRKLSNHSIVDRA